MIEQNPITGEPVIVAPDRARRPNLYRTGEACPFCPGNEAMTPPEICRIGDPWRVRVFPNKYPATPNHEIIVESSRHDATFDAIAQPDEVVAAYVDRYRAMIRDAAHVTLFKNEGQMAGASIPHLHSQIIATPFVPPRIEREAASFHSRCALCEVGREPLIAETAHYRWIAPRGSMFAYEQWIVPKTHRPELSEPLELPALLQDAARATRRIADSFNWIFLNFPREPLAHWYVQIFPRLAVHAGFELGSASAINSVEAEAAARALQRHRS